MNLKKNIDEALSASHAASAVEGDFPYLPGIIETLEDIAAAYEHSDYSLLKKRASGLGRLVSEDYEFMNSELGGLLSDIVTEISKY